MVSGIIPLIIEVNGEPKCRVVWHNRDVNSPRAFRPWRYGMEVGVILFQISSSV